MPFLTGENVLQALDVGVVIHDAKGAIRSANVAATRILGLTREQLVGLLTVDVPWRFVHPDGKPLTNDQLPSETTLRTGKPCSCVLVGVERGDGARAWLSVSTDVISGPQGERAGVVATFTDVTWLRNAQVELQNAHDRLQAINDAVPGIIFQYLVGDDGQDSFPFMAGRVEETFGVSVADAIVDASRIWAVVRAEDRPTLRAAVERSRRDLAPFDELVFLALSEPKWLHVRATPLRVVGGTLWTGVMTDITEERKLQDALRDRQRRESMGSLAAGVAHNFNNMLAVIMPNIELALAEPNAAAESLDDALAAARRAATLVRQLLYIGRGGARLHREPVDLRAAIDEVVALAKRTFDRRITITVDNTLAHAYVLGTLAHVQQVFLNLLLNSRDALRTAAQPEVRISLRRAAGPIAEARVLSAEHFVVVVEDNGEGMSDETMHRAGEPFFTTKPPGSGTGLGLATVIETVRDMGGTYEVSSTVGAGTRTTLRLPLADARPQPSVRRAPRTVRERCRILVVDDEPMVRRVYRRAIERANMIPIEAEDGVQALALLDASDATSPIDAVLLDISMPGVSGIEVLQKVKASRPNMPVVILSGDAGAQPGLELADAVLQKPAAETSVIEALLSALHSRN